MDTKDYGNVQFVKYVQQVAETKHLLVGTCKLRRGLSCFVLLRNDLNSELGNFCNLEVKLLLTGFFYSYFQGSWKIEAFSLCMFLLLPNLREVPHGTKGTGPKFVTRPAYSRSQLRNNTNTVSALVHLIHLLHVSCTRYTGIAHHRALQTSGEVGLTPRQYTEWNVAGCARSTGDPSQ